MIIIKYLFENEAALELYFTVTKQYGVKMNPKGFDDVVYISEEFMIECLSDIAPAQTS